MTTLPEGSGLELAGPIPMEIPDSPQGVLRLNWRELLFGEPNFILFEDE